MSDYFGDALASSDDTYDRQFRAAAAISHGRARWTRSSITRLLTTSDVARMISLRSTDRLMELWLAGDGAATAGAVNVGAHTAGAEHDGAVIDADYFATAVASPSTAARAEILAERSAATGVNMGKPLWEMLGLSADPGGYIDLTLTPSTTFTDTAPVVVLAALYTAGD